MKKVFDRASLVIAGVAVLLLATFSIAPHYSVQASAVDDACNVSGVDNSELCDDMKNSSGLTNMVTNIINTALYIVGILAVAMIIFSGIRYVTSSGDKGRVAQAKQILIYSVTGLIVAICAYAIVNFVLSRF